MSFVLPRKLAAARAIALSLLACAASLCAGAMPPAFACGADSPCALDKGYYLHRLPAGWDGVSPLPLVMFFHGYGASAEEVMADAGLARAMSDIGALLVAPNGIDKGWSFGAGMPRDRDDIAFTKAVLDDVEARLPIDRRRELATGFSIGGSMTWWLACHLPGRFTAFAPIAGAFWEPMPTSCEAGPVSIRHIHGLADKTVPMKGRAVGGGKFKQGDVMESWHRRLDWDGCPAKPDVEEARDGMTCSSWSAASCTSGHAMELCLHPGEHEIVPRWIVAGFRWMERNGKPE